MSPKRTTKEKMDEAVKTGYCTKHPDQRAYVLQCCFRCWVRYNKQYDEGDTTHIPDNVMRRLKAERDPNSTLYAVLKGKRS